ncbi:hypothetical protein VTH82DRAFT_7007 [Thermothelomyces myriococcoides]
MVVCRYYQQGYCRFGNACRNEHPPKGGQENYNRFGALSGQGNRGMGGRAPDTPAYPGLTAEAIERDLRSELPQWILSCYGPGRDAPEQLWGGYPREQSFEEIRLHFMLGAMAGNPQGALNDIQNLYQNAQQQIQHTLNNIPAAIQFIIDAEKTHPNRIDICKATSGGATPGNALESQRNPFQQSAPPANPFGAPSATTTTAGGGGFGQPSVLGQKPNPFGAPATTPAFGQPTQPAAPAFGQPATLGASSPFGRPPQTSAFGQTSVLGAKPNPFGAPSQSQQAQPAAPAFGQPGFGQPGLLGQRPNPFGTPAGGGGGFSATSQSAPQNNPFGQPAQQPQQAQATLSPFGQPANNQPANNPFGQPSAASPFGQPTAATPSPFAQLSQQQQQQQPPQLQQQQQPTANPFGAPAASTAPANPFGQPAATTSPFSAAGGTTATSAPSPFGQANASAPTSTSAAASNANPYGPNATRQHPDISTYAAHNPDKTLRMFKGKPVTYEEPKPGAKPVPVVRNFDGSKIRIWMPNGAPPYTTQTEAEPEKYQDPTVMQQWKTFVETGRFAGGVMPEVPPKREFCMWDF